jgi:lysozyme family protein
MASFALYFPLEGQLEGTVYENVPGDQPTRWGLIINDMTAYYGRPGTVDDVKNLNATTASAILKKLYWDFFLADGIVNQNLAEFIVDSALLNGKDTIAIAVQEIVNVQADGKPGAITLAAINKANPFEVYCKMYGYRLRLFDAIVQNNPAKKVFYAGWRNRLNAIKVSPI